MTAPAPPLRDHLVRLSTSTALVLLILAIIARDFPLAGHDLGYYLPRLLDTLLHQQLNGWLTVQWYTPAFGGGLPAYPNPQHLQFTLLQLLTLGVNPWLAYLATTAAASYGGFYGLARFLERSVGLAAPASTLGALIFVGNGFYIEHLIVGHVGFQLFPLTAVILWALTDAGGSVLRRACMVALVAGAMLYHAGAYTVILAAFSIAIALPIAILVTHREVAFRRAALVAIAALPLAAIIAASKVYAVLAFMRQFPRQIDDVYGVGLAQALAGFVAQFAGVMSLAPLFVVLGIDPSRVSGALMRLTGASERTGIWEVDVSVSPVALVLAVLGVWSAGRRLARPGLIEIDRRTVAAAAAAAVVTWLLIEATLARGVFYPWLKPLPILRSLHVNSRIAAAFILPIAIVAAAEAHRRHSDGRSRMMAVLFGLCLAAPLTYFLLPAGVHQRSFDLRSSLTTYDTIRGGNTLPVTRIVSEDDGQALAMGASSYATYEPLFGYDLSEFRREVVPGDIHEVRGGAFNMTNPAGLVFPALNGLYPFERIRVEDRANLDAFVRRGQPEWAIPHVQRWLDWTSLAGVLLTTAGAFAPRTRLRR